MRLIPLMIVACALGAQAVPHPYDLQVARQVAGLKATGERERLAAAQALGFLRSASAGEALAGALGDSSAAVRRNAALSLGWCGGRGHLGALIKSLSDADWSVRQAAQVALFNLTAQEVGFDAMAGEAARAGQVRAREEACAAILGEEQPAALLKGLRSGDRLRVERACRALGALRVKGVSEEIAATIEPWRGRGKLDFADKAMVQAGLRALGQLREEGNLERLLRWVEHPYWARYAAEAMGELGDGRAVAPLVALYPRFARDLAGKAPRELPHDDKPGLEPADRMYETPFAIANALSRLPLETPAAREAVGSIAPLLLANLPADFDGALLYEPEAARQITAHLLERVGLREVAARAALAVINQPKAPLATDFHKAAARKVGPVYHAASWLPTLCTDRSYVDALMPLLEHEEGWVRINTAKALMFIGDGRAIGPIARILDASRREADYGYFGQFRFDTSWQGQDEYDDPSPRWREAYTRALGRLGAGDQVPLLIRLLDDEANALEIRTAAALALDEIGSVGALEALGRAERGHPFHSIRLLAREALWRRGTLVGRVESGAVTSPAASAAGSTMRSIVFIKGDRKMPNRFQIDPWRQTYSTTDSGPTYRIGRNLYRLELGEKRVTALTHFEDGFVADCEVSWDGRSILFARRGGDADPWWHLYRINADGSELTQLTRGPYHDVQPAFLPDGRIVFSTSRTGIRDEYHGYPATGLAVMNADATDLHCIGFNFGRDNEPSILPDGRIVFSRLELFYSRLKTELTVQAAHPDGTHNVTLYGPERRDYWAQVTREAKEGWWGEVPPRHRVLRTTQPQALDAQRLIAASTAGLVIIGPSRSGEQVIAHDRALALTSPFPLDNGMIICAGSPKTTTLVKSKPVFTDEADLGLYLLDPGTGKTELIYNDPDAADFEPRPLVARVPPPVIPPAPRTNQYSARFLCGSVFETQDALVRERGKLVRVVEGTPVVGRHATHNSPGIEAWKNHVGTLARVLGTVPLATDGSFFVEVPADRMVHVQVLDSDRRVVGNQLIWMYARPGESRSCVGCHESPAASPRAGQTHPLAARAGAVPCLPTGQDFNYRAKFWNKGVLTDEAEERTRTVRAVNLLGRE